MLSLEISPNSAAGCEKFPKQSDKRWVPQVFVHMVLEAVELCSGPPQSQIKFNVLPDYYIAISYASFQNLSHETTNFKFDLFTVENLFQL